MTFEWTDERVDRLRAMHSDGAPFGDIASELGTTELSAKKKAHRLGLPKRTASYSANIRWQSGERSPGFFRLDFRRNAKASAPRYIGPVEAIGSHPVDLIERTGCCYVTTDHSPHLFCNLPVGRGDYCEFHAARMYV